MTVAHHSDFLHQHRVLLFFIEFNILICICKRENDTFEPSTIICPTATTTVSVPASHHEKKKATKVGHALDPQGMLHQHTDVPGYQNFLRMSNAFFDLTKECIHLGLKKSAINFRNPLEVGFKLAITLRHLATGETYTSLQYHWFFGHTATCKFVSHVC